MEVLNIILGLVLAFSGFPIGTLLAKIAKEEIQKGRKYFQWMQWTLVAVMFVSLVFWNVRIFEDPRIFAFMCSLIFLYGLPTAALVKK